MNVLTQTPRLSAAIDMSTGEFSVASVGQAEIATELARLSPKELLLPDALLAHEEFALLFKALHPVGQHPCAAPSRGNRKH